MDAACNNLWTFERNSYSHVREVLRIELWLFLEGTNACTKSFSLNSFWLYVAEKCLVSFIPRKSVWFATVKTLLRR